MRLAARLAPAFEDAYDLFQVPAEFRKHASAADLRGDEYQNDKNNNSDEATTTSHEDDDLDIEISDLEKSEALLRQEMEQANLFSKLVMNSLGSGGGDFAFPFPDDSPTSALTGETTSSFEPNPLPSVSEADIGSSDLDAPEQNLVLPPIDEDNHVINQSPAASTNKKQVEQLSTPNRADSKEVSTPSTHSPTPIVAMGRTPVAYDLKTHQKFMGVTVENGWYMVNMNRFLLPPSHRKMSAQLPCMFDYCVTCPETRLKNWYIGFSETSGKDKKHNFKLSPLPVRTSVIRIRPDVLCGAVMDAVYTATTTLIGNEPDQIREHSILRRQGGHLQLVLTTTAEDLQFLVDLQLCAHKSNQCPRSLIIRIFRCIHSEQGEKQSSPPKTSTSYVRVSDMEDPKLPAACLHLREACALVQRIEIEATNATITPRHQIKFRPAQSPSFSDSDAIAQAFGKHLRKTYKACPSTKEGNMTLPALNSDDWQLLKASWVWSDAIWGELESRSLTYSSLATTRFGSFPCLPTLDVHYCSQIRKYSKEIMVVQLLKSATHLEEYARDSEYACANVIALLRKAYIDYGVEPPPLPVAIPLTSYPLEHASPQSICPPWGLKVMEALNHVQARVDEAKQEFSFGKEYYGDELEAFVRDSTELAAHSVASVIEAFQRQDDEEKGARLQRKNRQVMERLSVMKKHQMVSVELLDQCTADKAQQAADDMHTKAKVREVPLLKFGVVVGSSTGTCTVTARHIIFVTQFLPVLGMGQKVSVFSLKDVEFELRENSPMFLTALPTIIALEKDGQEVYSFRPSAGGVRIKNFLDIIKSIACESKSVLSS
ncbi:hypothetical protein ACA910_011330 [Epithemia clementina (nom. ined.)]